MNGSANSPLYFETKIAEILGIKRGDIRQLRTERLEKKKEWLTIGRDIVLTAPGLGRLLAVLCESRNSAKDLVADFSAAIVPEKKEGAGKRGRGILGRLLLCDRSSVSTAAPAPAIVQLTVRRCYPNSRLLQAITLHGELVDVRVRNNQNFVPKMKLAARLEPDGRYRLEGRCPRYRGRY